MTLRWSSKLLGVLLVISQPAAAAAQAPDALTAAIAAHREGQRLRRRAVEEQSEPVWLQARDAYGRAVTAYRAIFLAGDASERACELRYNLADALFWSERYAEAETEYARQRDECSDRVPEAGRRVVEAIQRQIEGAGVEARVEPPEVTGTPPRAPQLVMPALIERLFRARDVYLARVDDAHDNEQVRDAYAYNNALLLYVYGRWPEARRRFRRIYRARCWSPRQVDLGVVAWEMLYRIAVARQQTALVQRLARQMAERPCRELEPDLAGCMDCGGEHRLRYRRGLELFNRAEATDGHEQRRLYGAAAEELLRGASEYPEDAQADLARMYAAEAYARIERWAEAAELFQAVIDRGPAPASADPDERRAQDDRLLHATERLREVEQHLVAPVP